MSRTAALWILAIAFFAVAVDCRQISGSNIADPGNATMDSEADQVNRIWAAVKSMKIYGAKQPYPKLDKQVGDDYKYDSDEEKELNTRIYKKLIGTNGTGTLPRQVFIVIAALYASSLLWST
uniref:Cystatin domain-containing protein n=1 Tax=Steinernema glaseri TaxID=37863 RepID=A0A1I8AHH7_9BILA